MTIKASSQITISKVIDIHACYRYYKLQGSTLAKPTKPTKNPPDGWSDTEPAYISGSTNTLYFVDCNVYSDKSFSFSEVSKSSSYEAAKDAWNKANKAQDTATNAQNKVDNLQVGGRNLILDSVNLSKWIYTGVDGYDAKVNEYNTTKYPSGKYTECTCVKAGAGPYISGGSYNNTNKIMKGDVVTLSGWVYCSVDKGPLNPTIEFASSVTWTVRPNLCTTWSYFECVIISGKDVIPSSPGIAICFYNTFAVNEVIAFSSFKLEKGNKATDWTPAPEDIDNRFDAAETRITQAETSIETTNNQVALKASTETVTEIANKANNLDKALTDAKTVIRQNSDAIASLTARDFKVEFTTITKQLETLNGDLSSYKEEIGNWMRFDAEGNLVLGATRVPGQDAYELKLTKNRISFMLNDDEVAYISNNELYITNSTVVQNLKIGRFVWEIRGNGNLGLVWR